MAENFVKWSVFVWVVSIVTLIVVGLLGTQINLMTNLSEMSSDIAVIKNEIVHINKALNAEDLTKR